MSGLLDGRRVLVTGATSGIGEATAAAVVAAGGRVALMARSPDRVAEVAGRLGSDAVGVPGDVTDPEVTARCVAAAVAALGGLDAVVCSAGVVKPGGITETGPGDWRAMFEVNVLGVLHTVGAALPHLRDAARADVVNLSSMSGRRRASVALGLYSASKFAVHALSDSLREELAPDGVRVSVVSPGFVRTSIFDDIADDEARAHYLTQLEAKGLDPSTVAAQIVHVLAQPPEINLVEVAMMSSDQ
jgi:NADP-dependent 3-hydroxy acid dehydrogenase YdfG